MEIYILNGNKFTDKAASYQYLKEVFHFPAYFGNNLDALYDCLTESYTHCSIILVHSQVLLNQLGPYGNRMISTFEDIAQQYPDFQFEMK